jgi:polyphosphate glucokinase
LGTGVGTAIFRDGAVMPHLELAHHPIHGKKTYDEYLGNDARREHRRKVWNKRVGRMIRILDTLINYDTLYLGGGNAEHVTLDLPANVHLASNDAGLTGGFKLWAEPSPMPPVT